jgi:hypothetical protein
MGKLNKFANWQEDNQIRREQILDEFINSVRQKRVTTKNITDLAALAAEYISKAEGTPCNKSTLMRNGRYKKKLLDYHIPNLGQNLSDNNGRGTTLAAMEALLLTETLKNSNLKNELERLNIYIKHLETTAIERANENPLLESNFPAVNKVTQNALSDYEVKFFRTCQALWLLLNHYNKILQVDLDGRRILDLSRTRNNTIVDSEVGGPFFDWLESQPGAMREKW